MTVPKKIAIFSGLLAFVLMVALFFFVFNPLGLGPEPTTVLPPVFFANPMQDLSELKLLVDGKEAFNEIFAAIDAAESSVYIQTYIWKVIMTDGRIVALGSANLTPRSMLTSKEITLFVHGVSSSPFIRKLREQLERDIAVSEEVLKPFKLGPLEKVKAVVGKYVW